MSVIGRGAFRTLHFIMAVCLLASALMAGRPLTAVGVHCPTAPVQVLFREGSADTPTPGDREFRQCCCRERATGKSMNLTQSDGGQEVYAVLMVFELGAPLFHKAMKDLGQPVIAFSDPVREPGLPPPNRV